MGDFTVLFLPQLLPEDADPEGSVRYKCYIIHEQIRTDSAYSLKHYNGIREKNTFIVEEKSKEFKKAYNVRLGKGTVVRHADGSYAWWFDSLNFDGGYDK